MTSVKNRDLIYGIDKYGFVIIGCSDYDYSRNTSIIELMKEYKKVKLDDEFDANINFLPNGITDLWIGSSFNHSLDNLPLTLKHLKIKKINSIGYIEFNQSLDYLPYALESLYIGFTNNCIKLDNLPSSLKILYINNHYSSSAITKQNININNLPDSIEELFVMSINYASVNRLPANLKKMIIRFNDKIGSNKEDHDNFIERFQNKNIIFSS